MRIELKTIKEPIKIFQMGRRVCYNDAGDKVTNINVVTLVV